MYQGMCAIVTVRNAVLEKSDTCPTKDIQDCNMDEWVAKDCPVTCDNSCEPANPFKCGSWQTMTRSVVVRNDDCGIRCPTRVHTKRCGQFKWPVNCVMSSWSGWSKCTAECEGGIKSHTRSILVKAKNGGQSCNTPEESAACNTASCTFLCFFLFGGNFEKERCSVFRDIDC